MDIKIYFTEFLFIIDNNEYSYIDFIKNIYKPSDKLIFASKYISREKNMFDSMMKELDLATMNNAFYHNKVMFKNPIMNTIKMSHHNTKYGESLCVPIIFYDSNINEKIINYNLEKITHRIVVNLSQYKDCFRMINTILNYIDPYPKDNYDILKDF